MVLFKAEIKMRARQIERRRREEARNRGEKAPKRIAKQCQAQAAGEFIAEREEEARVQAKRDFRRKNPADFDAREKSSLLAAAESYRVRKQQILASIDAQLKDDIDPSTGLCSEPHLNLNKYCRNYTGW